MKLLEKSRYFMLFTLILLPQYLQITGGFDQSLFGARVCLPLMSPQR